MILLLGGTSETRLIATPLAEAGHVVLVSTATDEPLELGSHPNIRRRVGRLDQDALEALARQQGAAAIVDAAHPYAAAVHSAAAAAAARLHLPYFRYVRSASVRPSCVHVAADHAEAAGVAFSFARPVLLTTGSRNLAAYVERSRAADIRLIVRVLDRADSVEACLAAGIARGDIIAGKGPFSVERNREHIRRHGIGVLVTKDSGEAGGLAAKLDAAERENCHVVLVERPALPPGGVASVNELVAAVLACL